MKPLTPLQGRVLAVMLLLFVTVGVVAAIAWPLGAELARAKTRATSLEQELEHTKRVIESRPILQQKLAVLKRMDMSGGYYLRGQTPAVASAQLQAHLKRLVERHGGTLISAQTLPVSAAGSAFSVGLKVHLNGSLETLVKVSHALEMGRPMLFINSLAVTPSRSVRSAATEPATTDFLDVRLELVGYTRGPQS